MEERDGAPHRTSGRVDAGWAAEIGVRNRKLLALLAVLVMGAGLALNWSGLVAAGIAPILLALAPCATMCALGLCMNKSEGKTCAGGKNDGAVSTHAENNVGKGGQ